LHNVITDVPGIKVGHYTDREAATGCTVVLCEEGAVAGVDVRGSAPGTRETDLLAPTNLVTEVQAIFLSGGSAFGLDAAAGVMRYLEERGHGFPAGAARVPIVPAAIIFDLSVGSASIRPTPQDAYQACLAATAGPVAEGTVGAGTGATVGKVLGPGLRMKGGLGTASRRVGGFTVGALVVVNALGDVVDPQTGKILAGPRDLERGGFLSTTEVLMGGAAPSPFEGNTTLGVVATNARLDKAQATKLAQMAQDGLARAIRPSHTMFDGDAVFALAMGKGEGVAEVTVLGVVAAEVVAQAVVRAIMKAEGIHGIPSARDWPSYTGKRDNRDSSLRSE